MKLQRVISWNGTHETHSKTNLSTKGKRKWAVWGGYTVLRVRVPASATRQALGSCPFDSHATLLLLLLPYLLFSLTWWLSNFGLRPGLFMIFACHSFITRPKWGEVFKTMLDFLTYVCLGDKVICHETSQLYIYRKICMTLSPLVFKEMAYEFIRSFTITVSELIVC